MAPLNQVGGARCCRQFNLTNTPPCGGCGSQAGTQLYRPRSSRGSQTWRAALRRAPGPVCDLPSLDGIDSHPTAKLEGGDITLLEWLCTRGPCAAWWSKCSGSEGTLTLLREFV